MLLINIKVDDYLNPRFAVKPQVVHCVSIAVAE